MSLLVGLPIPLLPVFLATGLAATVALGQATEGMWNAKPSPVCFWSLSAGTILPAYWWTDFQPVAAPRPRLGWYLLTFCDWTSNGLMSTCLSAPGEGTIWLHRLASGFPDLQAWEKGRAGMVPFWQPAQGSSIPS